MRFTTLLLDANCIKIAGSQWSKAMVDVPIRVWRYVKTINKINIHCMRVFTSRSWPHYCLYWMFLENICIYSHAIGLVTHMLDCPDLPMDAHQRGFRSGYTECRLMKKWVYAVYLRIPSTTPLVTVFGSAQKGIKHWILNQFILVNSESGFGRQLNYHTTSVFVKKQ